MADKNSKHGKDSRRFEIPGIDGHRIVYILVNQIPSYVRSFLNLFFILFNFVLTDLLTVWVVFWIQNWKSNNE